MMAAGDVTTLPPGGAHSPRLHPHLVALVRWCASCVWGAAALLRRLLELPPAVRSLPPLAALLRRTLQLSAARRRRPAAARAPHISAHATVECEVLRAPPHAAAVDVIFVHGLYGSLENTWRQGQWGSKRKLELNRIPSKRPAPESAIPCSCNEQDTDVFPDLKKPRNDHTCLCTYTDNQVHCITRNNYEENVAQNTSLNNNKLRIMKETKDSIVKEYENNVENKAAVGISNNTNECGCIEGGKYIRNNYNANIGKYILSNITIADNYDNFMSESFTNDARNGFKLFEEDCDNIDLISSSINKNGAMIETNIKTSICDNLTAETEGYVSNSKVNNKIKTDQMHMKVKQDNKVEEKNEKDATSQCNGGSEASSECNGEDETRRSCEVGCGCVCSACYSTCWPRDWLGVDYPDARVISINYTSDPYLWRPIWIKESKRLRLHERAEQMMQQLVALGVGSRPIVWVGHSKGGLFIKQIYAEAYAAYVGGGGGGGGAASRAQLWSRTAGFMFYSVPHRGSPLADIDLTPLVARSVELLEMGKDCTEVLGLQRRWLRAAAGGAPVVRSLVETCRTLMAVLWLRIVSVESADAGIGALCGVSVDHREICKPSGRRCLLYRELRHVIDSVLGRERAAIHLS